MDTASIGQERKKFLQISDNWFTLCPNIDIMDWDSLLGTDLNLRIFYFSYLITSHACNAQLSPYSVYNRYKEFPRRIWDIDNPLHLNNGIIHPWIARNTYLVLLMTITSYLSFICMMFGIQVKLMSILCAVSLMYMQGVCGLIQQRWHSLDMACISTIWICFYLNNIISINACDFLMFISIGHSYLSSGYQKIIHSGLIGWLYGDTLRHTIIEYKSIWLPDVLRYILIDSEYSRPLLVFCQLMTLLLECGLSLLLLVLVACVNFSDYFNFATKSDSTVIFGFIIIFICIFSIIFHILIWLMSTITFSGHVICLLYLILNQLCIIYFDSQSSSYNQGISLIEWFIISIYTCLLIHVTIINDEFYPLSSYGFFVYDCSENNKQSYPKNKNDLVEKADDMCYDEHIPWKKDYISSFIIVEYKSIVYKFDMIDIIFDEKLNQMQKSLILKTFSVWAQMDEICIRMANSHFWRQLLARSVLYVIKYEKLEFKTLEESHWFNRIVIALYKNYEKRIQNYFCHRFACTNNDLNITECGVQLSFEKHVKEFFAVTLK